MITKDKFLYDENMKWLLKNKFPYNNYVKKILIKYKLLK